MARRVLVLSGLLFASTASSGAQLNAKRKELSRIQVELKQTLRELQDLRDAEKSLGEDVKGLENRDSLSRRRVEGLQSDIRRAEARRLDLKSRLDAAKSVAGFWSAAIAAESARHAALLSARSEVYGTRELWAEEFRRSAIVEKAGHLRGLHGFSQKTAQAQEESSRRARDLGESRRQALTERDLRRKEYEEKRAALEATQMKVAAAARRAKELEESAKAMAALLDKLGKAGKYRKAGPVARLDRPAHSLPWPIAGKVIRPFGRERDEQLGTWSVRQGVVFSATAGSPVSAIAPGTVIFTGPFRSYGNVVIIDHASGFFSVYGELGEIVKNKGDGVKGREKIANAGERLYLEIRKGTEALDPAAWLESK